MLAATACLENAKFCCRHYFALLRNYFLPNRETHFDLLKNEMHATLTAQTGYVTASFDSSLICSVSNSDCLSAPALKKVLSGFP